MLEKSDGAFALADRDLERRLVAVVQPILGLGRRRVERGQIGDRAS